MPGLTLRRALGALAVAAAALGSAAAAVAAPTGPCQNLTYVGVCDTERDQPNRRSQQGMGEIIIPDGNSSFQTVG